MEERKRLRQAREDRKLKQWQVADAIKCSVDAVSLWERGGGITEHWRRELCAFYSKRPSELELGEDPYITEGEVAMLQKILGSVNLDRRQALELVKQIPALAVLVDVLAEPGVAGIVAPGQFLSQCTAAINAGFQLLRYGNYNTLEVLLHENIPTLTQLANTPGEHQKVAANLAVQAKILQINMAMRNLNFAAREAYALEAVEFGRISGKPFTLATAQYWQGDTYICCYSQPQTAIDILTNALVDLSSEAGLSRSAIYTGLSVACAQDKTQEKYETKARDYMDLARKNMPEYPELEPLHDCLNGHSELDDLEGQMYLALAEHSPNGDYAKKAYDAFALSLSKPAKTKGRRAQVLIRKADAARALGDLHEYAICLEQGIRIAIEIDSKRRKSEAKKALNKALNEWKNEQAYQNLLRMF